MGSFDEKSQEERFEAIRQATSNYYGTPEWIRRCEYCGELLGRIKVTVYEGPTEQELEEIDAILQLQGRKSKMNDVVHKKTVNNPNQTLCEQYGYSTFLSHRVTCEKCKEMMAML